VSLTEIVVLVIVVAFMAGMGALVYYANTPPKENPRQGIQKK
jgi:hypothetical protein